MTINERIEPELKALIKEGRQKGYVTIDDLHRMLPDEITSSEKALDAIAHQLEELNIELLEEAWGIDIPFLTLEGPNYTYPSDINELRGATRGFIRSDEEGMLDPDGEFLFGNWRNETAEFYGFEAEFVAPIVQNNKYRNNQD